MSDYNIIGDIAGQYLTLKALLEKMPKDATPVSVGDMVDRGPRSKEVLEFFKENGLAVLGNHEHMFVDACRKKGYYIPEGWFNNGGTHTVMSFFPDVDWSITNCFHYLSKINEENKELLDWVESLPLYLELEGAFVSHAPKRPDWTLELACKVGEEINYLTDDTIIWNRGNPRRMENRLQLFGHNAHWGLKHFNDIKGEFAICIDTSNSKVLTGIHWPSGQIYQQEYIG